MKIKILKNVKLKVHDDDVKTTTKSKYPGNILDATFKV